MIEESRCRYCNVKVSKGSKICSECSKKLKLVKQFRKICDAIKENTKPKPDLVEVVRCKNCAFCGTDISYYCRKYMIWVDKEDFCSYGKRSDAK